MTLRTRRIIAFLVSLATLAVVVYTTIPKTTPTSQVSQTAAQGGPAMTALAKLAIKGRAPQTGYTREQFGNGWSTTNGCDTRDIILNRDLQQVATNAKCQITKGILNDPYTGKVIDFLRGGESSSAVQIDHVVALGDAWQKGAQLLAKAVRIQLANDPLELLAVDGPANQQKSDGDAATWLPPNKAFRCEYVARQIAVKIKYTLWITQAEHDAMVSVLGSCPTQTMPA